MSAGDLFVFSLDDLVIYRWPRRIILGAVLLTIVLLTGLGEVTSRVLFGAVIFLWLMSEIFDVPRKSRQQP